MRNTGGRDEASEGRYFKFEILGFASIDFGKQKACRMTDTGVGIDCTYGHGWSTIMFFPAQILYGDTCIDRTV